MIESQLTLPMTFIDEEVTAAFNLIQTVLELKANQLRRFTKEHGVRRKPIGSSAALPSIRHDANKVHNKWSIFCLVINTLIKHCAHDARIYLEAGEQNFTVLFDENKKSSLLTCLKQAQNYWKETEFPRLVKWRLGMENNQLKVHCQGLAYTPSLFAYCFRVSKEVFIKDFDLLSNEHKKNKISDFSIFLPPITDRPVDPTVDYPMVTKLLTSTAIRLDFNTDFFQLVEGYCHQILRDESIFDETRFAMALMLILRMCEQHKPDAHKAAEAISNLYENFTSNMPDIDAHPEKYHYFTMINQYCNMLTICERLNAHANKHERFATSKADNIAVMLPLNQKTDVFRAEIDLSLIPTPVKEAHIRAFNLCSAPIHITYEFLQSLGESLGTLDAFLKSTYPSVEAKASLAQVCYFRLLKDVSNCLSTITAEQREHKTCSQEQMESLFTLTYSLSKHVHQFYPDPTHREDCFMYFYVFGSRLINYYIENKKWSEAELFIAKYVELSRQYPKIKLDACDIRLNLAITKLQLNTGRGNLSQAILSYQELCDYFQTRFRQFHRNKLSKQLPMLQDVFQLAFNIFHQGQLLVEVLAKAEHFAMALQVNQATLENIHHFTSQLHSLVKAPLCLNPTFSKFVQDELEEAENLATKRRKRYLNRHMTNLTQCIESLEPKTEISCVGKSLSNVSIKLKPTQEEDVEFLYQSLRHAKCDVTKKQDLLRVERVDTIEVSTLEAAILSAPKFKEKARRKAEQQNAKEQPGQDHEPIQRITPSYRYFVEMYQSSQLYRVSKPKTSGKKKTTRSANTQATAIAKPAPLVVDFGPEFGVYDEASANKGPIIALQDDYRPFGLFFGFIHPALPKTVQAHFWPALQRGAIVTGKGREGVKFFKKMGQKAWKIKIPRQDEFLVGHIAKEWLGDDQHGLPVRRFLICFDEVQNHKQEQRQKKQGMQAT